MSRIYCKGELVEVILKEGWLVCSGCGRRLWRSDATFALAGQKIPRG